MVVHKSPAIIKLANWPLYLILILSLVGCSLSPSGVQVPAAAASGTGTPAAGGGPLLAIPSVFPPEPTQPAATNFPEATATSLPTATPTKNPGILFAALGDYGLDGVGLKQVSDLIKSWNPDFIITLGDNNYPDGAASTIDANIGKYFHDYIAPYKGKYDNGASQNRFFPALGNHDWITPNAKPYLDYFTLPGNGRYYTFTKGPVQFFVMDSDEHEPDGVGRSSAQAAWLKAQLAASHAPWRIVYFHHPPYSSGTTHGSTDWMQWPFKAWGASAVLSGHEHNYERLEVDGIPYFVNGLGGAASYEFGTPLPQSKMHYTGSLGAMLVEATATSINFKFINVEGKVIDDFTVKSP